MGGMNATAEIVFPSYAAGIAAIVWLERRFEPNAQQGRLYDAWFERRQPLWPLPAADAEAL